VTRHNAVRILLLLLLLLLLFLLHNFSNDIMLKSVLAIGLGLMQVMSHYLLSSM